MPTTNYIWDPETDSYLMETDESGATTAAYTSEPALFGPLISQRRDDQTSYYHYDALGSTRQLTDASEGVINTSLYDAWGVNVDSTGATPNPFQWVGEPGYYRDAETDQFSVRHRSYAPFISRWTAPISTLEVFIAFLVRQYLYARNDPASRSEPLGVGDSPAPSEASIIVRLPRTGPYGGRIRTIERSRNCHGPFECHHLLPQTFWDSPSTPGFPTVPAGLRNDCRNLCCIPVTVHHLTTGGGAANWYTEFVRTLIRDHCGLRRPDPLCLLAVAKELATMFQCCLFCYCKKPSQECRRCQLVDPPQNRPLPHTWPG